MSNAPNAEEKNRIHGIVSGWPTARFIRENTGNWPVAWFDEAIESLPRFMSANCIPEILPVLRELREERRADVYPGENLRNAFLEKMRDEPTRRRVLTLLSCIALVLVPILYFELN